MQNILVVDEFGRSFSLMMPVPVPMEIDAALLIAVCCFIRSNSNCFSFFSISFFAYHHVYVVHGMVRPNCYTSLGLCWAKRFRNSDSVCSFTFSYCIFTCYAPTMRKRASRKRARAWKRCRQFESMMMNVWVYWLLLRWECIFVHSIMAICCRCCCCCCWLIIIRVQYLLLFKKMKALLELLEI